MTLLHDPAPPQATVTVEGIDIGGALQRRVDPRFAPPPTPGFLERWMVIATVFVLIHGLPVDWFQTRAGFKAQDGNLKMVVAQLALMMLGILRVAGYLDWLIRAIKLDGLIFAFAGLAVASTLWSPDPFETAKQSFVLAVVTLYAAYLVLRFTLREIIVLLARMFVISGLINLAFVFAVPQFAIDGDLWDGVFFQKNALGFTALLAVPILLAAGREAGQFRFIYYLSVPVQFVLLFGSQSKTMLVATIASVALLFLYRMFRGRRTLRGAVLLGVLVASLFTVGFATANLGLLTDFLDKDVTLTGRIPLWQDLLPLVSARPFLGYGYEAAFAGFFSPVHDIWVTIGWRPTHAHNAIMQVWMELGLVGVAVFLVLFVRGMTRALNMLTVVPGAVGLWPLVYISAALLTGITESGIVHSLVGWMLFAVAAMSASYHTSESVPV